MQLDSHSEFCQSCARAVEVSLGNSRATKSDQRKEVQLFLCCPVCEAQRLLLTVRSVENSDSPKIVMIIRPSDLQHFFPVMFDPDKHTETSGKPALVLLFYPSAWEDFCRTLTAT